MASISFYVYQNTGASFLPQRFFRFLFLGVISAVCIAAVAVNVAAVAFNVAAVAVANGGSGESASRNSRSALFPVSLRPFARHDSFNSATVADNNVRVGDGDKNTKEVVSN
tara:strand:- start:124 stop:456 length:333 start_codon:yes stop_codon:yes gene_type:complete